MCTLFFPSLHEMENCLISYIQFEVHKICLTRRKERFSKKLLTCRSLKHVLSYTPWHLMTKILPRPFLLANTFYDCCNVFEALYGNTNCTCHHISCTSKQLAYVFSIEAFLTQESCLRAQLLGVEPCAN